MRHLKISHNRELLPWHILKCKGKGKFPEHREGCGCSTGPRYDQIIGPHTEALSLGRVTPPWQTHNLTAERQGVTSKTSITSSYPAISCWCHPFLREIKSQRERGPSGDAEMCSPRTQQRVEKLEMKFDIK